MSVGSVAWAVTPSGRVCGTAIGMPWKDTDRRTPSRSTSIRTASQNRSHCQSGSGPCSSRNSWPDWSRRA